MQHRFSRHSTFSEQPSSLQTKCVQTFYQDRHGAKFEDKCFVQPRSWKKKKKSFPRHEIPSRVVQPRFTSFRVIRYLRFDVVRALMIPTTKWISIMICMRLTSQRAKFSSVQPTKIMKSFRS